MRTWSGTRPTRPKEVRWVDPTIQDHRADWDTLSRVAQFRGGPGATIAEGLQQTRAYLDRCDAEAGHLIVFDRAPERSWEEKIFRRDAPPVASAAPVTVWGM